MPDSATFTWRAVAAATAYVAIAEESANGSSKLRTITGASSAAFGSRISSWWSVPKRSATWRAYGSSSYEAAAAPKPIENVVRRPLVTSRMLATTTLESTPPDRNAPRGTSLSSRSRTASRISSRRRWASSAGASRIGDASAGSDQ